MPEKGQVEEFDPLEEVLSEKGDRIEVNERELTAALIETLQRLARPQPLRVNGPESQSTSPQSRRNTMSHRPPRIRTGTGGTERRGGQAYSTAEPVPLTHQTPRSYGVKTDGYSGPTCVHNFLCFLMCSNGAKTAVLKRNHQRTGSVAQSFAVSKVPTNTTRPISRDFQQPFWPLPEEATTNNHDPPPMFNNSTDASTSSKHMYLTELAKALLCYGAPTHRVEAYMAGAAAGLGLEAKFFYLPDHFVLSFDDNNSYKSEFQLVKGAGNDLGKLDDVHATYKLVNRDLISVDQALFRLELIAVQKPRYNDWFLFFIYGLAAIGIGPFAYRARFIDLPISFGMGTILGVFQLKFIPANSLYHKVFEITTVIFMSFLGRMFGSIRGADGDRIFCYSAITQSTINLILPGYWITNAGLELMNHQLVAGATRMMYAIIYFLFLAYGIAVGSALYGFMDADAVSEAVCSNVIDRHWNLLFVPFFSIQVAIISRAKPKQIPAMVIITFLSYGATFVTVNIFNGSFTFANTIGGFVIGVLGNLYGRVGAKVERAISAIFSRNSKQTKRISTTINPLPHDADEKGQGGPGVMAAATTFSGPGFALAAAAMVPAMIVQVPSGLSAIGAVLTGIQTADAVVRNETANALTPAPLGEIQTSGLPVLLNVIQIGISIGFGLSLAAMLTYTGSGLKRSGLMSW